ncbi:LuxR C-terminal-related transcriptional regulator [Thermoactinomyces mirandus]|uniref:Response regulator transcription factor n=1 Tax=Thermoactinomyces mirandus TaxID=2756294 RepID=A0A7W1XUH7_9BACL|nr:response regulator transcription factor [Thermoactinomyces mirandus]MBA4603480.1 response regulator transcription factor [Thermoactinomyces mirandus]
MGNEQSGSEKMTKNSDQSPPIRVLIADSDSGYRNRIKSALDYENDILLVGESSKGNEVPFLCGMVHPHVVILNLYLPQIDGVEITYRLSQIMPQTKILILADCADPYVLESIRLGASGFLVKNTQTEIVVETIRVLVRGDVYIHPALMKGMVHELRRLSRVEGAFYYHYATVPHVSWKDILTYREMEVLRLMAQGKNNRTIGEHLFISEKTVKNHVSNILYKLNVHDRTQAVLLAIKYGWVQLI